MDVVDDAEGPLDPRIQIELENLNNATDDINKLETELDMARNAFKQLLSDSTRKLKEIADKIGTNCIEKARCYYEALEVAHQARIECQKQAQLFQRASEIHAAAKETVAVAEARFMSHQHEWNFDQAWQDMLNHATIKVMDAENQKAECGREHHRRAMLFHDAEKKVQQLEEKYHRSIIKARPYFELRAQCDQMLATQKERVECLHKAVKEVKLTYTSSLRALEEISNQIHQQRRDYDIVANGPREPGVGAELVNPQDNLNYETELNKLNLSRINSLTCSEADMDERTKDFEDVQELKQRMEYLGGRSVDGSESTSNQWELELQASMEKLNNLSQRNYNNESEDVKRLPSKSDETLSNVIDQTNPVVNLSKSNEFLRLEQRSQIFQFSKDLNIFKKPLINTSPAHTQGWQSLTQSPINSILNKSKIAFRNSISKSLSNSPVNIGSFGFKKTKDTDKCIVPNRISDVDISEQKSQNIQTYESSKNVRIPNERLVETSDTDTSSSSISSSSKNSGNSSNTYITSEGTLMKRLEQKECTFEMEKLPMRKHPNVKNVQNTSHSLNSSPMKMKYLIRKPTSKNEEYKKCSNAEIYSDSTKELPLLSLVESSLQKGKSCSMINLDDKQSLKTLLDHSNLGNIQAVSVERLANVRHSLVNKNYTVENNVNT